MDISKFLSKVIGFYLIIVTSAMLLNIHQFTNNVANLMNDAPLLFITGVFTLVLGLLMVVSHNIWEWNWRVVITIFSWIALLKGIGILFYPQMMNKSAFFLIEHTSIAYLGAVCDLVIGIILCYFGCKR
ncbi:MAG: hypothetical protein V4501_11815 [Pseudomonadota bacterium]